MEITAKAERDATAQALIEHFHSLAVQIGLKFVFVVGVRGADDVRYAFGNGCLCECNGVFDCFGAIVNVKQKMIMNIEHVKTTFRSEFTTGRRGQILKWALKNLRS